MQTTVSSTKANLYLLLVTAIWGLTFPLIRNAIMQISPFEFVCVRFGVSAVLLLPLVWRSLRQTDLKLLLACLVLGLLYGGSYITQTIGLETTSSARAAFIMGFSVILVPLLLPFYRLANPTPIELLSSGICLLGLYILTGADLTQVTSGDMWVGLSALCFALAIPFLQWITLRYKDYKLLTFYPIVFICPFAYLFAGKLHMQGLLNPQVVVGVLFCAIGATCVALVLQTKYQKFTSASKATLIYAFEPLFASIFGYLINGEAITHKTVIGGLLILFSLTLPELIRLGLHPTRYKLK